MLGDTAGWTYFVVPADESASKFRSDLEEYEAGEGPRVLEEFFGSIEGIERYGPSDRRGPGLPPPGYLGEATVDVLLWPSGDDQEAVRRLDDAVAAVEAARGTVLASDRRALSTMARVRVSENGLDMLLELMVVERIRAPVAPFLEPSDWHVPVADDLIAQAPIDVTVGVIDDGVHARHPLLADLVGLQINVPENRQWSDPGIHGSMVAGLAAYGDLEEALRDQMSLPAPAKLAVARVLEPDPNNPQDTRFPTDEPEHIVIQDAIRGLHDEGVRVINLSIADRHAYSGPHASIWTETLDRLARELDVLIVTAAGNRPIAPSGEVSDGVYAHAHYPDYTLDSEARIAEPGIAANVATVGSIARSGASSRPDGRSDPKDIAIAQVNELSPFSRTGPGVNGTYQLGAIKPEFVHYGGNTVWTSLSRLQNNDPGAAVVSTASSAVGRLFAASSGTASPRRVWLERQQKSFIVTPVRAPTSFVCYLASLPSSPTRLGCNSQTKRTNTERSDTGCPTRRGPWSQGGAVLCSSTMARWLWTPL